MPLRACPPMAGEPEVLQGGGERGRVVGRHQSGVRSDDFANRRYVDWRRPVSRLPSPPAGQPKALVQRRKRK